TGRKSTGSRCCSRWAPFRRRKDNFSAAARVQYRMRRSCMRRFIILATTALQLLFALHAFAQSSSATLKLTVVDPTGAVLAGADVTIVASDVAAAAEKKEAQTDAEGVATIGQLTPGRYVIEASFPGFETRQLKDVRLRNGDNKQLLLLPLQKMER